MTLPIPLISSTQLTHMLDKVRAALQKTNPDCTLLFPDFYFSYHMKLVSFGYDMDSNLLFQFLVFIEPYTHTPLALYQLESTCAYQRKQYRGKYLNLVAVQERLFDYDRRKLYSFDISRIIHANILDINILVNQYFWQNTRHHRAVNWQYFLPFVRHYQWQMWV